MPFTTVVFEAADIQTAIKVCVAQANGGPVDYSSVFKFANKCNSSAKGSFVEVKFTVNGVTGIPNSIKFDAIQASAISPLTAEGAAEVNARKDPKYGLTVPRKGVDAQISLYPYTREIKIDSEKFCIAPGEIPPTEDDMVPIYYVLHHFSIAWVAHIKMMKEQRLIISASDIAQGIAPGGVVHGVMELKDVIQTHITSKDAKPENIGKKLAIPILRAKLKFNEYQQARFKAYNKQKVQPNLQPGMPDTYDVLFAPDGSPIKANNVHKALVKGTKIEGLLSIYVMLHSMGISAVRAITLIIADVPEYQNEVSLESLGYGAANVVPVQQQQPQLATMPSNPYQQQGQQQFVVPVQQPQFQQQPPAQQFQQPAQQFQQPPAQQPAQQFQQPPAQQFQQPPAQQFQQQPPAQQQQYQQPPAQQFQQQQPMTAELLATMVQSAQIN